MDTTKTPAAANQGAPDQDRATEERAYERYKSLSEKIRAWLIVYGVSIAALFVTQAAALSHVSRSFTLLVLIPAFTAVTMQLVLVLTIKYQNLIVYKAYSDDEPLKKTDWKYKAANWWSQAIWVDILVDTLTVIFYAAATIALTFAIASKSTPPNNSATPNTHTNKSGEKDGRQKKGDQEGRKEEGRQKDGKEKEQEEGNKEKSKEEDKQKESKEKAITP